MMGLVAGGFQTLRLWESSLQEFSALTCSPAWAIAATLKDIVEIGDASAFPQGNRQEQRYFNFNRAILGWKMERAGLRFAEQPL